MILTALKLLYLLLPAAVANMAPVAAKRVRMMDILGTPLDNGKRWRGKPVLGPHKTWRGIVAGVSLSILVTAVQLSIGPTQYDLINYQQDWLLAGVLLGLGALVGDAIKSFFKRRAGVPAGSPWVPFDQIDFGIGAVVFMLPLVWVGAAQSVLAVALLGIGHVFIVRVGFMLGWRKERW